MEPTISYVRSADGMRIAYWTLGSGPPLLLLPNLPVSSIEIEWRIEPCRAWYESLAKDRCLIGFDGRGAGLSERNVSDFSLAAQTADARAVIQRTGHKRLPLFAILHSCPMAVMLSLDENTPVERLMLWAPYARGEDYARSPAVRAARSLLADDWAEFIRTVGFYAFGWTYPEQARAIQTWYSEATSQQNVIAQLSARDQVDVAQDLERVAAPTLVLYRRHAAWPRLETSATVAAAIPDATFAVVDGTTTNPWSEGHEEIQRLVDAFLARPVQKAQRRAPSLPPLNPQTPPARLFGLTFRELEVLQHVAAGASNQEIATALFLSVRTVEKHIANIYGKLELRGRADAAAFAVRKGLVPSA